MVHIPTGDIPLACPGNVTLKAAILIKKGELYGLIYNECQDFPKSGIVAQTFKGKKTEFMESNKHGLNEKPAANRYLRFIKRNGVTILMLISIGILFSSPDAKSFVLRQLAATGLFNTNIDQKSPEALPAKTFYFTDENGNIQNTASLRGKVVFINFWASWCPPCRAEFPSIEKLYTQFKDNADIVFLTINEDSDLHTAKAFLKKEKYSIPLLTIHGNIPKEIYSGTLPTTILLDKGGKIRFHHTGLANYTSGKFVKQLKKLISE